ISCYFFCSVTSNLLAVLCLIRFSWLLELIRAIVHFSPKDTVSLMSSTIEVLSWLSPSHLVCHAATSSLAWLDHFLSCLFWLLFLILGSIPHQIRYCCHYLCCKPWCHTFL